MVNFSFCLKDGYEKLQAKFFKLHPSPSLPFATTESQLAIVSSVNKLLFLSSHWCEDIFQQSKVGQNSVTELLSANMFWNNVIGVIICDKTSKQTFGASTLCQSEWRKVGAREVSFIITSFDSYQLVWDQIFVFHVPTDALAQNHEKKNQALNSLDNLCLAVDSDRLNWQ